jgi:Asp-tRNA(Asn)/Glu-tRNA(Gln) amidotransferase A subunit family amidase
LAGVPFVVKDNFLAFGAPTTAASKMLENFNAPLQATAVEKLEAEGAICIGKANLDAFAHGGFVISQCQTTQTRQVLNIAGRNSYHINIIPLKKAAHQSERLYFSKFYYIE